MKKRNLLFASIILAVFINSCEQPLPPEKDVDVLTYSLISSDTSLTAQIRYRDGNNEIVHLIDQSLPWEVSIELPEAFSGEASMSVEIPEDEVFIPFLSGTADGQEDMKLNDSENDFISGGVLIGDYVYTSLVFADYTMVESIDSAHSLTLETNLLDTADEEYYLYHEKFLTPSILCNDEVVITRVIPGVKNFSFLVKDKVR